MDFGDIEITKSNGKYGLVNRINQSTILDCIFDEIWAYDFLGKNGAFILYRDDAYYLYDVAKNTVSESYSSMCVFDTHFFVVRQGYGKYKLFDPVFLFEKELGTATELSSEFIIFQVGDRFGLGVTGCSGGPDNEPASHYFSKYHLESVLLYPEYDSISIVSSVFSWRTEKFIEARRNNLIYLFSFEAHNYDDGYHFTAGLNREGFERIEYGDHYVSAFRDGFWEMFRYGTSFVGRGRNYFLGYHDPYLEIDGKILLGRTLAGEFLCDSVDEIVENCGWEYEYVRYVVYKAGGRCGLWQFSDNRKQLLKNHYNSILPLYHDSGDGYRGVTHFIVSDEKDRKGVYDVKRACFIISCSYKTIIPVSCRRINDNGHIKNDILMGFLVSGSFPNSTGVLGTDGEIICPLRFLNPKSEADLKESMLSVVQHSHLWNGCYIGEDESPIYLLRDEDGCYAFYYWGESFIDQAVDSIVVYQPKRKWKDVFFLIVKRGKMYGLFQDKMGLEVIEDIACDEIRLIEDLECFLVVKNGESSLYSFKEKSE